MSEEITFTILLLKKRISDLEIKLKAKDKQIEELEAKLSSTPVEVKTPTPIARKKK